MQITAAGSERDVEINEISKKLTKNMNSLLMSMETFHDIHYNCSSINKKIFWDKHISLRLG